jgi:sec-independent protein translocase protein TatA
MLAAGPFGLGPLEIGIIVLVVILIFGVGKVADLGGALGKSVREFRREARAQDPPEEPEAPGTPSQTITRSCTNCGEGLADEAKFCAKCGTPTQATV